MKTNLPKWARLAHSTLLPALFFLLLTGSAAGQSQLTTFELAVKLDSLYDISQVEKEGYAARLFFDELQRRYQWENTEYDLMKDYFYSNIYLKDKVDIVYDELVSKGLADKDRRTQLFEQKTKLENEVFDVAYLLCQDEKRGIQFLSTDTTCSYRKIIAKYTEEYYEKLDVVKIIREIMDEVRIDTSIRNEAKADIQGRFKSLADKIKKKKREISELKDEATRLSSSSGAASGLALSGSHDIGLDGPAPIVIQTPGSSSLESSLIDATSKWIAERMREELSMAFFERFEVWLAEKNIKILFPNTFSALKSSVTTDYALMIQIFRSAFEKDLEQLPFQLTDYLAMELGYRENVKNIEKELLNAWFNMQKIDSIYNKTSIKLNTISNEISTAYEKLDSLYDQIDYTIETQDEKLTSAIEYANEKVNELVIKSDLVYFRLDSLNNLRFLQSEKFYGNHSTEGEAFKILKYVLLTTKALKILSEGKHPTNLMSFMRNNVDEFLPDAGNIKPALVILDEVSKSLIKTSNTGKTAWLSRKEQNMLREDPQLLTLFFGILSEDIKQGLTKEINEIELYKQNTISSLQTNNELPYQTSYLSEVISSDAGFMIDRLLSDAELLSPDYIASSIDTFYSSTAQFYEISISPDDIEYVKYQLIATFETLMQDDAFMSKLTANTVANSEYNSFLNTFRDSIQIVLDSLGSDRFSTDIEYFIDDARTDLFYELDLWNEEVLQTYGSLDSLQEAFTSDILSALQRQEDSLFFEQIQPLIVTYIKKDFNQINANRTLSNELQEIKANTINVIIQPIQSHEANKYYKAISSHEEIIKIDIKLNKAYGNLEFARRLLMDDQRNLLSIVGNFLNLADRIDQLKIEFDKLKEKENSSIGPQEKIYLLQSSLEALEQVFRIALKSDAPTLQTVNGLSKNVLDAYTAVLEKDYDAIVMNVMYISDSILELSYRQKTKGLIDEIESLKKEKEFNQTGKLYKDLKHKEKKELRTIYKELKKQEKKSDSEITYEQIIVEKERKQQRMQEIFRYGAFLAAVVEANNSDEIKTAIRAISLPAGSYNIKRRHKFNISLNAYPGITGGAEQAFTATNDKWAGNMGFTAPVGLALSWGYTSKVDGFKYLFDKSYADRIDKYPIVRGNRFPNGHSGSIYFSLIDLGAVVLYRFDNETDPLPSDIGFQQIFSPGVAYAHGFRGIPISLMLGGSLSPQLRKIDETGANSFRLNASVVVDLPMANFHTKKRYRKN